VHGESISGLTGARAAVWRPGDGGKETTEEALGAVKIGRASPFCRGAEVSGLNGRRQCLDLKAWVTGVKRGKSR
jgi:hypothetical protein